MFKFAVSLLVALIFFGVLTFVRKDPIGVTSPVPEVYGTHETVAEENVWYPKTKKDVGRDDLYLTAKSAILADYDSGAVIFAKDSTKNLPAASTIKIMTALVAMENSPLSATLEATEKATQTGENSMLLVRGERLTLEELLYGLILVSGNDAAVVIAEGVGGTEEAFVGQMNNKVRVLGLGDSLFINASGLDVDNVVQYSSSYDLVTIARYLWEKYPEFRKISQTEHIFIEPTSTHQSYELYNDTNLLTTYPGVKGIKPGFTWEAGYCLVTYAENDGKRLIGVILGSEDRRGEMIELLDYGFAKYGITVSHPGLDL